MKFVEVDELWFLLGPIFHRTNSTNNVHRLADVHVINYSLSYFA